MKKKSGRGRVRVNRSVLQGKIRTQATRGTSSQSGRNLSQSVDLRSSLESKLQLLLDVSGSPEFTLRWKIWTISSKLLICALRASPRRTGDSVCGSWPTPCAQDGPNGGPSQGRDRLPGAAATASWGTPSATIWGGTAEQGLERKRKAVARGIPMGISVTCLDHQVKLATGPGRKSSGA